MNLDTAHEIADLSCAFPRQQLDAIRFLRAETRMDLRSAKTYLDEHSAMGMNSTALFEQLKRDFVKSTEDLLTEARVALRHAQKYVEHLEEQLAFERQEKAAAREAQDREAISEELVADNHC